uniref:Uncharacterized protein n=1 Tax=Odontella aurita TaxID=265563 RepID=A0A7S4I2S2_9STRA|mmetsp:Transcript_19081/g.55461  ORF Transcript_19081/g.55461 Transcript_19081/m.55461 type:complete len:431 (+) Transcript_19081:792-2084(+)
MPWCKCGVTFLVRGGNQNRQALWHLNEHRKQCATLRKTLPIFPLKLPAVPSILHVPSILQALIKEPAWILSFASLVASNVLSKSKMERALFALCRLDAWRVRDSVGECRTVIFTLPGQSCSPTLTPLLQKAFPHERHVFAYDSCAEAIRRGIALRRGGKRPSAAAAPDGGTGNASVFAEIAVMPQAVTATAPLSPLRTVSKIANALATLPTDHADTAEAWMASIDRVLSMKADEADNGYLPFVCRMGFLMGRTGQLGNGDVDVSELALTNVLQYVTGTRSRPPKAEVLDAAREVLRAMKEECEALVVDVKLTDAQVKAVEDFAFEHKGILIQDKTLLDTVQPKKEWSLKAAKKLTGCACCGPEEEEDEDEAGAGAAGGAGPSNARGIDMSVPGAGAIGLKQRTGASSSSARRSSYVDGKSTFAFDPTKFS